MLCSISIKMVDIKIQIRGRSGFLFLFSQEIIIPSSKNSMVFNWYNNTDRKGIKKSRIPIGRKYLM